MKIPEKTWQNMKTCKIFKKHKKHDENHTKWLPSKSQKTIRKILTKYLILASEHKKNLLPFSVPLVSVSKP